MTIEEIDKKISELQQERKNLEKQRREDFLNEARKNVGRCFKVNSVYVKVLDVPQTEYTINSSYFNEYQYPAIYLRGDMLFDYDTLFSGAWGVGDAPAGTKYEEITKEEFNKEFDRRITSFVNSIKEV